MTRQTARTNGRALKRLAAITIAVMTAGAAGAQTTSPAPDPGTLPKGHPSLEEMMAAQAAKLAAERANGANGVNGAPLPVDSGAAPAVSPHGTMGLGGMGGMGGAGGMKAMPEANGVVTVKVVQGTAGAPPVGKKTVTLTLTHRGAPLREPVSAETGADGTVRFEKLPVMPPPEVNVRVSHAGIEQDATLGTLTPSKAELSGEMKVMETTEVAPAWTVAMRHVQIRGWGADGAVVHEMMRLSVPGDRVYVGAGPAGAKVTVAVPLPAGARDLDAGEESATRVENGQVVTGLPVYPGDNELSFQYTVPVTGGRLGLTLAAPAPVARMILFTPADGAKVTAAGLSGGEPFQMGETAVRKFDGAGIAAGGVVTVTAEGIGGGAAGPVALSAKNVAVAGGLAVALAGVGVLLMKPKGKKA